MMLADLGAPVLRWSTRGGDVTRGWGRRTTGLTGLSRYYLSVNRNRVDRARRATPAVWSRCGGSRRPDVLVVTCRAARGSSACRWTLRAESRA
jgi:hypothetical protein